MTDRHDADRTIWLLRTVPAAASGRLVAGLTVFGAAMVGFWASGVLDTDGHPDASPSAAVFFAVILGYIVPVFHFIAAHAREQFDALAPLLRTEAAVAAAWRRSIDHRSRRWTTVVLAAGFVLGVAHNLVLAAPATGSGFTDPTSGAYMATVVGTLAVWVVMTTVVVTLTEIALLFRKLADDVAVDLLRVGALTPFASVAVVSTLALIGAQAAFPILWLHPDVHPASFVPGIVATATPMVVIFVVPVWGIHRAIGAAKRTELARVDDAIRRQPPPDVTDPRSLETLNPLLVYRREIAQVNEWPFNVSVVSRLAFYLVIPPLTWTGAALIEMTIERWL